MTSDLEFALSSIQPHSWTVMAVFRFAKLHAFLFLIPEVWPLAVFVTKLCTSLLNYHPDIHFLITIHCLSSSFLSHKLCNYLVDMAFCVPHQ